jgi:hypothetical protein
LRALPARNAVCKMRMRHAPSLTTATCRRWQAAATEQL